MALAIKKTGPVSLRCRPAAPVRPRRVVCLAQKSGVENFTDSCKRLTLPAMVAAVLVASAFDGSEALAAKSGGRVGGSSGFSSRRQQPSRTVNNYQSTTVVAAPPVVVAPSYGYGYGGFGGFHFMPTFFMPTFFPFSGLLSIFFLMIVLSVVFNVIRAFSSGGSNNNSKKDDWGDL